MNARRLLPFLATLLFVIGCDNLTQTSKVPMGTRQETRSQSCSYAGLCRACEFTSGGHQRCYLGYHNSCDGHRDAVVNVQQFKTTYKSGRQDIEEQDSVDHYLTECR